jgi:hypothetical protein
MTAILKLSWLWSGVFYVQVHFYCSFEAASVFFFYDESCGRSLIPTTLQTLGNAEL